MPSGTITSHRVVWHGGIAGMVTSVGTYVHVRVYFSCLRTPHPAPRVRMRRLSPPGCRCVGWEALARMAPTLQLALAAAAALGVWVWAMVLVSLLLLSLSLVGVTIE